MKIPRDLFIGAFPGRCSGGFKVKTAAQFSEEIKDLLLRLLVSTLNLTPPHPHPNRPS